MLKIKSLVWDNPSKIAYLSDEIYEITEDVFPVKKGDKVRLIGDNPETIGYNHFDQKYYVVCDITAKVAQYVGVLKCYTKKL